MNDLNLNNWPTLARAAWRSRYRFALPALGVFALVWVGSLFVPRTYDATARFRRSADAVATLAGEAAAAPIRRTVEQDLTSRAALEAIADDPALPFAATFARADTGELTDAGRRARARFVDDLAGKISVSAAVSSDAVDVVAVTARDSDPRRAAALANRLVEHYLMTSRDRLAAQLAEALAFFTKQIETRQDELGMLRLQRAQLEQDNPTLVDSGASAARDGLIAARAELRAVEQQLVQVEQEHDTLTAWAAQQPDQLEQRTRGRNPEVAQLNAQKAQLEQELGEHRYKWGRTDDHPLVEKTLAKIASLDAKLASTPQVIDLTAQRQDNPAKLDARAKLESLGAIRRTLTSRRDTLRSEAEQLVAQQQVHFLGRDEHADVTRRIAAAQQDLDFWQNKRREVTLAQSAGGTFSGGLSFVERAAPPRAASFPRPGSPTLAALLAGLVAGVGVVIATRVTDRSFNSAEDAQRELDLPVLGVVAQTPPAGKIEPLRAAA